MIQKLTAYLLLLNCFNVGAGEIGKSGKILEREYLLVADTLLLDGKLMHPDTNLIPGMIQKEDPIPCLLSGTDVDTVNVPGQIADSIKGWNNPALNDSLQNDTVQTKETPVLEAPINYNATDSIVIATDIKKVFLYKGRCNHISGYRVKSRLHCS